MSRGPAARVECNKSLAHDYSARRGKKGTGRRLLSAQFNYLCARNPGVYRPSRRTHSCCPPANLRTLNQAPK